MKMRPGRILFWLILASIVAIATYWLLRPAAIMVETATVTSGRFVAATHRQADGSGDARMDVDEQITVREACALFLAQNDACGARLRWSGRCSRPRAISKWPRS
jgi:hypothetical protein